MSTLSIPEPISSEYLDLDRIKPISNKTNGTVTWKNSKRSPSTSAKRSSPSSSSTTLSALTDTASESYFSNYEGANTEETSKLKAVDNCDMEFVIGNTPIQQKSFTDTANGRLSPSIVSLYNKAFTPDPHLVAQLLGGEDSDYSNVVHNKSNSFWLGLKNGLKQKNVEKLQSSSQNMKKFSSTDTSQSIQKLQSPTRKIEKLPSQTLKIIPSPHKSQKVENLQSPAQEIEKRSSKFPKSEEISSQSTNEDKLPPNSKNADFLPQSQKSLKKSEVLLTRSQLTRSDNLQNHHISENEAVQTAGGKIQLDKKELEHWDNETPLSANWYISPPEDPKMALITLLVETHRRIICSADHSNLNTRNNIDYCINSLQTNYDIDPECCGCVWPFIDPDDNPEHYKDDIGNRKYYFLTSEGEGWDWEDQDFSAPLNYLIERRKKLKALVLMMKDELFYITERFLDLSKKFQHKIVRDSRLRKRFESVGLDLVYKRAHLDNMHHLYHRVKKLYDAYLPLYSEA